MNILKDEITGRTSYYTCYRNGKDKIKRGQGCFSSIFYKGRLDDISSRTYHVYAFIGFGCTVSNNCFMTKEEVEEHLGYLNDIVPLERYSVKETKFPYPGTKGIPAFDISIKLKNQKRIKHKYALTWIRYIYEYPYNLILMDSRRLKKGLLQDETMINLFTLVVRCFKCSKYMYGAGHAMPLPASSGFISDVDVIKKLDGTMKLNSIFPTTSVKVPTLPGGSETKFLEYWAANEYFDQRAKIYMEAYKKLKRQ